MPTQKNRAHKIPAYRQRAGYTQALVTLSDSVSKQRRDYWLGEFNTAESRERYHRLIAAWEAAGRRLPAPLWDQPQPSAVNALTIVEVIRDYWAWAKGYYHPRHVQTIGTALRLLRQSFGSMPITEFGPNKLRELRDGMVRGELPHRRRWSRKYINAQVQRIRHMFKWAVGHELIPVAIHQALCTLEPLRRGRCEAIERSKVMPAPPGLVNNVMPLLTSPVATVVKLQLLTGARPGELLSLRPCDIEIDDNLGVWTYTPQEHKNAHREHERVIYFGPQAQQIIRPFLLDRTTNAFLFSPAESEAERRLKGNKQRKTPAKQGNGPGKNRRETPIRKPGERFTTNTYHRAVQYACDRAFPPPSHLARRNGETIKAWRARIAADGLSLELNEWRKSHRFHPHQLRHTAATELRKAFGLEAAQLTLGHASAQITDAIYAERDRAKVIEIMRKIG